uniref:Uncharacterized protein n=1 Tax=viral metagenome TaxID=1070528 RepID=A0A6C0CGD7_9ZZZZ
MSTTFLIERLDEIFDHPARQPSASRLGRFLSGSSAKEVTKVYVLILVA